MSFISTYSSPLGAIILTGSPSGLTGLYFAQGEPTRECEKHFCVNENSKALISAKKWLDKYFDGKNPQSCEVSMAPLRGTPFRLAVWRMLCDIPYGETVTYGDLAKKIAAETGCVRMSGQAVGGAVGSNPISIIIPCHRVVGSGGNLTGYAGGLDKKAALLKLEGADMSRFFARQAL